MNYQQAIDKLGQATDNATLGKAISDIISARVGSTQNDTQNSLRSFILHHQSPIGLRINSALKYLQQFLEDKPKHPTDYKGTVEGFYTKNNTKLAEGYLIIGAANLQGILFCINVDKVKDEVTVRRVISEITDAQAKLDIQKPLTHATGVSSSYDKTVTALDQLNKLMNHQRIIEVEVDPKDTPDYREYLYNGLWHTNKTLKELQDSYKTTSP